MKPATPILLLLAGVYAGGVGAETWAPVPDDSALTFTAEQQGAEFEGEFREFTATFDLDPADPTAARIEAVITVASVDTAYADRDEYLRGDEWFDAARWPQARFVTRNIRATSTGYIADGLLTLRDQSREVPLAFTLEPLPDGRLQFRGSTLIQRLDFGVGQGEWTNTDWVGNDVTIRVDLVLEPVLP